MPKPTRNIRQDLLVEITDRHPHRVHPKILNGLALEGHKLNILALGNCSDSGDQNRPIDGTSLNLKDYASAANTKIRELYPKFLFGFAKASGLMDLHRFDNRVSLFWFLPISEMSPLRNSLIDKLYKLVVTDMALSDRNYDSLILITDDPSIEDPVRQIAERRGVKVRKVIKVEEQGKNFLRGSMGLSIKWWTTFLIDILYWLLIKFFRIGQLETLPQSDKYAVGLTLFPVLWVTGQKLHEMNNRSVGDWPALLEEHGYVNTYLALPTLRINEYLKGGSNWRRRTQKNRIFLTHSLITLKELFKSYDRSRWGHKLQIWFESISNMKAEFDGIDINRLVQEEFNQELWQKELATCQYIMLAASKLINRLNGIKSSYLSFEFQPIEKAFVAGIKNTSSELLTVGLQTSFMGNGQLGYHFPAEYGISNNYPDSNAAPLPDLMATYGTQPFEMLRSNMGSDRVLMTGPIRYPYLQIPTTRDRSEAATRIKRRLGLGVDVIPIILALPSLDDEARTILDWAFQIGNEFTNIYYLVRFHYWAEIKKYMKQSAGLHMFDQYNIENGDLRELLLGSKMILTGTSSIGVEAMILGCMPLVYETGRQYDLGKMEEVAEGSFFFSTRSELKLAIDACLKNSDEFQKRMVSWPHILPRLCSPIDGKASQRLFNKISSNGMKPEVLLEAK